MKQADKWVKSTVPFRNEWVRLIKFVQKDALAEAERVVLNGPQNPTEELRITRARIAKLRKSIC